MRPRIQTLYLVLLLVQAARSLHVSQNPVSRQGKNSESNKKIQNQPPCIEDGQLFNYGGECCDSSRPVRAEELGYGLYCMKASCIEVGERCSPVYDEDSCCPGTSCQQGDGLYAAHLCRRVATQAPVTASASATTLVPKTTMEASTTTTQSAETTLAATSTSTTPASTTTTPATTTVEPTTTTQAPATTTQAPATTTPAPTTSTLAPATTPEAPATITPAPTTRIPALTTSTASPTTSTPAPTTTTPAPMTATPAPKTITPAPTTTTPAPTTTIPVPTITTPAPTTTTPAPTTNTAAPATTMPAPRTSTPPPRTSTPAPATSTPAPATSTPVQTTSAPEPTTTSTDTPSGTTPAPGCIAGNTAGFTHGAHAVPGSYPPKINANSPVSYVDTDGDGFETVFISGDGSHTHVVDTTDPLDPKPGDVVSYKWTLEETGEVISTEVSFSYDFPVGVTTLLLEVEDTACDVSDATVTVTVTGAISQGAYCYYYNSQALPTGEGLKSDGNLKPTFATEYLMSFEGELVTPPASFGSVLFSARCFLLYETTEDSELTTLSVSTGGTGDAQIYKSSKLIGSSSEEAISAGLTLIELQYLRTSTAQPPQLSFLVNGTAVPLASMSYDRSLVLPVLTSISPNSSPTAGGGNALITGYGFYSEPFVRFGSADEVEASTTDMTPSSMTVQIPEAPANGPVSVTAARTLGGISSNVLEFVYDVGVEPIKFAEKVLTQNGETFQATFTTSIAYFDGSWYLGRIGGFIRKLTVSADLEVTSSCDSPSLRDPKFSKDGIPAQIDIFGIGFDPRDTVGRPYVTAGTIYFFLLKKIDTTNMDAHMNGRIDRFGPGDGCLVHEGQIASGLPMADHDHGPSGFDWDNNGTMYITSAGVTNGGLPASLFGDMYETPLSAAVLTLTPDAPGFNGAITYDKNYSDHKNAKVTGGDFSVYATGIRNSFDMVYTSRDDLYASDNGPNIYARGDQDGYGRFSVSCSDDLPTDGAPARSDPDKILKITEGAWFGHSNLNRGKAGASAECQFINPLTNQNEATPPQNAPSGYTPPFFTVTSSVNGMAEYSAVHFNGAMKGDLLASTYSNKGFRNLYRIEVAPKEKKLSVLAKYGTLSVAMGVWGELLLPKYGGDFQVLEPDYTFPSTLSARVVKPFRGGAAGGLKVTITGHHFGSNPTIAFNGKNCQLSGSVVSTFRGDMVTCVTPPSGGGVNLVDVVISSDGASSTISEGFMYMSV